MSVIVPCSFFVLIFILHFLISLSIKLYLHGANAQHRSSHDTLSRSRKYSLFFFFFLLAETQHFLHEQALGSSGEKTKTLHLNRQKAISPD